MPLQTVIHQLLQLQAAFGHQNMSIFISILILQTQNFHGTWVDRQNITLIIDNHKTLAHIFGEHSKLTLLFFQFHHLFINLAALLLHILQQRTQFLIYGRL